MLAVRIALFPILLPQRQKLQRIVEFLKNWEFLILYF